MRTYMVGLPSYRRQVLDSTEVGDGMDPWQATAQWILTRFEGHSAIAEGRSAAFDGLTHRVHPKVEDWPLPHGVALSSG